jgi:hypothetical protein
MTGAKQSNEMLDCINADNMDNPPTTNPISRSPLILQAPTLKGCRDR